MVNSEVIKMLKNSPSVPVFTPIPKNKCYSFVKTCTEIERYFGPDTSEWPGPLRQFREQEKDLGLNAFGMAVAFLTDALIDDQTLKPGTYWEYSPESCSDPTESLEYMVLDAQALQHLEIVESFSGKEDGSLF